MTTIVRRKSGKARPEDHPLYDSLNDLGATLVHAERLVRQHALAAIGGSGEDLAGIIEELVGTCRAITTLGAGLEASLERDATNISPAKLYAGRTVENRRVMFLELVAWAIQEVEQAAVRGKLDKFASDLVWERRRNWQMMPWKGAANDPDRFARHVADLARGFTDADGFYPLHKASVD
jgi:hypothetical protein